ncbi:MAG: 3-phosphoserine/phosphohydroxythreonine transaminase [Saprospiraceae bacterium]|nr:3-phosphoserine/phosphohydroxythreonine transaminase [Saprospiraceae bacterium]
MKIHNFSAGPSILPASVFEEASRAVLNFTGNGLSILEISHRSKDFIKVMDEAEFLVRKLLHVPEEYAVLFLSGGASTQFFMAPMNLLPEGGKAAYADTGTWAAKAIKEAKIFGTVDVVASSKADNYTYIPKDNPVTSEHQYLHITSNNTIYGTQYHNFPEVAVPLVCDMSSDIFSRPFDISKFDMVYAGAQKNMGPAGTTLVIVKKSALGNTGRTLPAMVDFRNHIENGSMYNTPPVFAIYVSMLVLRWLDNLGGLVEIQKMNEHKAGLLYQEIERNSLFYCPVHVDDRSLMNVNFLLHDNTLEAAFLEHAKSVGCQGIAGHRSVGGFRASIYNAMPVEGVMALIGAMQSFEQQNG